MIKKLYAALLCGCRECEALLIKALLILTLLTLILVSCTTKQVYETSIKTYVISNKEKNTINQVVPGSIGVRYYYNYNIYLQTPNSTECTKVDQETYDKYNIGDTIHVLIKYWEKSK